MGRIPGFTGKLEKQEEKRGIEIDESLDDVEKEYRELLHDLQVAAQTDEEELQFLNELKKQVVLLGKRVATLEQEVRRRQDIFSQVQAAQTSPDEGLKLLTQLEELDQTIEHHADAISNELRKLQSLEQHELIKRAQLGKKQAKHLDKVLTTLRGRFSIATGYLQNAPGAIEYFRRHFSALKAKE